MEWDFTKTSHGVFSYAAVEIGLREMAFEVHLANGVLRSQDANLLAEHSLNHTDRWGNGTRYTFTYGWRDSAVQADYVVQTYNAPYTLVFVAIRNTGNAAVAMDKVVLLKLASGGLQLGGGIRDWVIYKNGIRKNDLVSSYHFGNPEFDLADVTARGNEDASLTMVKPDEEFVTVNSNYLTVLRAASSGRSILTGFTTMQKQFCFLRFTCDRSEQKFLSFEAFCAFDGKELGPGQTFTSEQLVIDVDESFQAIDRYAKFTAENAGATPTTAIPTGWCSWYFFYESVTEADIMNNLRLICDQGILAEYIQIDMGWEQRLGDWYPNHRFPHGMKWLVDKIHERGHKAGIWLSPFWVEPRSEVHRDKPEWLLRNEEGELITFRCHIDGYVIDTTIPEARAWIQETFRRVTEDWGFDYVKIDFLRAVSLDPKARYRYPATRAEALRLGMEAVRSGVGPHTYILACGGQYGPTLGIANGNRTSNDIGDNWASVRFTFKKNILRYWMANLWNNDPDCLLVRGPEEGKPGSIAGYQQHDPGTFGETESRTIATLFRMTGGLVFLGDDLTQLKEEKLDLIRPFLASSERAAVPRDLFTSRYPHLLHLAKEGNRHEIAVINWFDHPLEERIRLREALAEAQMTDEPVRPQQGIRRYDVREYWTHRSHGVLSLDDELSTGVIEPHGCRFYQLVATQE